MKFWTSRVGKTLRVSAFALAVAILPVSMVADFDQKNASLEIFFSAHGVPESYVEQAGDPYKEEMEQCIGFIIKELRVRRSQELRDFRAHASGAQGFDHDAGALTG